ncbi:hypothetical protein JW826_05835 [Candidatus Woesearchaeota archaeon]|nr:hypothetical protein [Candidatus Woesearchaeota archaeon]
MESIEQTIRMNNLSKELKKYGFAESSQEAIAQAGSIYGNGEERQTEIELAQMTRGQFNEIINKMQRLWMFKEASDQKISVIADQLVKVTDKLNEVIKTISLMEMNQTVFNKKLNVLREGAGSNASRVSAQPSQSQEHARESSDREREEARRLVEKPIDRNGVAPADVSIEKMFYCGTKR